MQTVTLPVSGVYKILLDPQFAGTGSADVQLFTVPADLSGPITPGTPLTVTTTAPGQNATYTFTGTINTRVSLNLTAVSIENLKVSVLKPDGTNLIVKTVGTSGGFGGPVKLPVGGTYKVVVDPQSSFYGSVTVGVYVVPPDTTGTLVLGTPLDDLDDRAGPERDAHLHRDRRPADQLQLHGRHDAEGQGDREGPRHEPADGPPVHRRDGQRLRRPVTLPRTGVYTVTIDPQGASTGSVTLTFYNVPADATGSTSCANTVPGQNCKLTLTVNSGTRTVTVTTNVPAAAGQTQSVSLTIYQGTTTTPANQVAFGTAGPAGNDFEVFFPANSTYTIVIDQFGSATGTTSVAIS